MTVLFCLSHISKSLQWLWFAEELKKRDIRQVYVLIDIGLGPVYLYDDLQKLGIEVYLVKHNNKLSYIKNLRKTISIINKRRIDVVHTSLPLGNIIGQTAAVFCGIQARVTTCENASWAHDFKNRKQLWIDKFTFSKSKRIIATSDIASAYLKSNWNFKKSKLRVIYHGLKKGEFDVSNERVENLRLQLKIDKQKNYVVGVVARYEYWKGHDFIIEAARLLKDYGNIKFYVFGSKTAYFDVVMKKIYELDLQNSIFYGGFVEDMPALFQLFDIHLHVPINEHVETGGITIIEGMMAERPQVLTLSGYAWQVSKHMHNAYVVPFQNGSAIAEAILWMRDNHEDAMRMASQAKKDAFMFSVESKTDRHLEVYNELLK
jgi:glycosyltransferase involved in cell wall biosynthesis